MLRDALIDPRYRSGEHGRALLGYHGVALRRRGITGWRRNQALFGRPDFVFPKTQTGNLRGRVFLALLPIPLQPARAESKVLETQAGCQSAA
jgi:hypothetical protein